MAPYSYSYVQSTERLSSHSLKILPHLLQLLESKETYEM